MEQNLNQENQSTLKPSVSEVSIRTMDLDIKALEQGGGEALAPQRFMPEEIKNGQTETGTKFEIPGYLGPEKPIFAPAKESLKLEIESPPSTFRWLKIIGIIIVVAILVVGFGFLAYFAVSHWIFPAQMPAAQ